MPRDRIDRLGRHCLSFVFQTLGTGVWLEIVTLDTTRSLEGPYTHFRDISRANTPLVSWFLILYRFLIELTPNLLPPTRDRRQTVGGLLLGR